MRELSSPFLIVSRSREVNQDATHEAGTKSIEMGTILPVNVLNIHQSKVDLVNQGRCLEGVTRSFGDHVPLSEPMELAVNHRHELLERLFVPRPPSLEEPRYLVR